MMKQLKLICSTDIHGYIYPINFASNETVPLGMSRIASYVKEEREKYDVLLLDNGDVNQGSPLVTYANKNESQNVMAKALNVLNYDYMNIGNHDFNFGSEFLADYIDQVEAKSLVSNVLYKEQPLGESRIINLPTHQLKIGLIGVVTDYIPNWEKPSNLTDLTILSVVDTVKQEVEKLRSDVDKIIVCYHGGLEKDPATGEPTEPLTGENVGYDLVTNIPGIDVLFSGHQHRSIVTHIGDTLVLQASNNAQEIMEITYQDGVFTGNLVQTSDYDNSQEFLAHFESVYAATQNWLDEKIGPGDEGLAVPDLIEEQKNPGAFTRLVNLAQLDFTGADISANSLYDSTMGFSEEITYRQLAANFPFPNTLVVMEVDGETLKEFLEWNANYWTMENGEVTVHPSYLEPKRQLYNYDIVEGVTFHTNVAKPVGERIEDLTYKGNPVQPTDTFRFVMNNYRASGGGNFHMLKKGKVLKEYTEEIIDVMYAYLQKIAEK